MTGLDQDMMQKNLTCRTLGDAQKNMLVFSVVLVLVTLFFMVLGALLFTYSNQSGIAVPAMDGSPKTDLLFPEIALHGELGIAASITFILGLVAAAYSSADSALTALTTSFCIDFLRIDHKEKKKQKSLRRVVHIGMSFLLVCVVILFKHVLDRNVIDGLLTFAGYTYGPLLGLFAFGIFTSYKIKDRYVWWVVVLSVFLTALIANVESDKLGGYILGLSLIHI